jgi:uncharacterized protein YgbK (DUF1537 family)
VGQLGFAFRDPGVVDGLDGASSYPWRMRFGCIADDLTGATDLGGTLVREGLRVALVVGARATDDRSAAHDAVILALKSRSIPAAGAVALALDALRSLRHAGAEQIYFKYASTFDSTPAGNIGPVTDALADALDARLVVACPAFPANGRIVRDGELIVDGVPLADGPMRSHPLNPMTESSVVRLLAAQTSRPVGLVDHRVVAGGAAAIRRRLGELRTAGVRHAVADASDEGDLDAIAEAIVDEPLVSGASALAGAIARRAARAPRPRPQTGLADLGGTPGAVLAGSASRATRAQVARFAATHATLVVDPAAALADRGLAERIVAEASRILEGGPVLVAAAAPREEPAPTAGAAIERVLGDVASRLVQRGVRRLVVAGGETSGSVVAALGLDRLEIGREIDPGVPVVVAPGAEGRPAIGLVLKSGNFGGDDFFERALGALAERCR